MKVLVVAALLGVWLSALACCCQAAQPAAALTRDAAIAEALTRSQELAAQRARIEAAEAMVKPAGARPDPMLSVGLRNIPVGSGIALDQDAMSGATVMVSQDFPPHTQRQLRSAAQRDEAEMMRAQYDDARNDMVRKVRRAYVDVQYRETARTVAKQNRDTAADMLSLAEAQYAVGRGMQSDVFLAQVRLSEMVDMVVMQEKERAMAASRLNRLRYRSPSEPIVVSPLSADPATLDAPALQQQVEQHNPALRGMAIAVERAGKSEQVAALMRRPMWSVSFEYMIRQAMEMDPMSGDDMWSAEVGITLPWVYRREKADEEVRGAKAERAATESDLAAMRNELAAMVEEMTLEVHRAEEQLSLLDTGLLPQAEAAYASARASYAATAAPMSELLDAQMNLRNLQLQRATLIYERERALADLDYATGSTAGLEVTREES